MKHFDRNIIIREASLTDAEQVCSIYNYYVKDTIVTFDTEEQSLTDFSKEMKEVLNKYPYFVAEKEGEILGYACVNEWKSRCAYEYSVESSIYLDPSQKGKGLGYALYFKLIKSLEQRRIHSVIAGISLPNVISVGLHEKMGFQKIAHFKEVGYKFNRWVDVGYWELILQFDPRNNN